MLPRHVRTLALSVGLLWVLTGVAVMCDFESPDLGCEAMLTEAECLAATNPHKPGDGACVWDADYAPRCATVEPDPATWTLARALAILVCLMLIEPFVVAVEWTFENVVNAPVRAARDAALASAQRKFVWAQLARETDTFKEEQDRMIFDRRPQNVRHHH